MVLLKNNLVLILETDGAWCEYENKIGLRHVECIEKYASAKGLGTVYEEEIIKQTSSVIIKNLHSGVLLVYLPKELTDNQLYELELLSTFSMNDLNYMEAIIYNEEQQEFVLKGDIGREFSNKVIQSYYEKKEKQRKR